MSDTFYRAVRAVGSAVFCCSSTPVVLGLDRIPRSGPCIIAANHTSPYDVALLIRHIPRLIDFVSIVEVFQNPIVAWFYGSMNAFPLDRSRPDAPTVRIILDRLERGRLVGMFPEGGFRRGDRSILRSGRLVPGIGRIATLGRAPIVPAVILNSGVYARPRSWFPTRATVYGMAFGNPIPPDLPPEEAESRLVQSLRALVADLSPRLPAHCRAI